MSGNITAEPGTEATNKIFKDVTGDIKIGADSSEVRVGTLTVQRKIILGAGNDCDSMLVETSAPKAACTGVRIKYIRNTHATNTMSILTRRSTRKSVRGDVPDISGSKWYTLEVVDPFNTLYKP